MSNTNFFNGLKQIGRNNLEGWMNYMEQMVPALAEGVVNGMTLDKILKEGMPQLSKVMTGANLNTLTDYMYYMVDNPLGTPSDVTGTKVFLLVVGERKTTANSHNPDILQLLYTLTPTFALHYRVGKLQDINTGEVPWINYRTLLKGDTGLNSYEFWKLSNPTGTEQDYWDSLKIKGDKGDQGDKGDIGLSAYEDWLNRGGIGTFEDFLGTLKGADAPSNFDEWLARNPGGTYAEFAEIYQGFRGWTPLFSTEIYGDKVLINLYDWQGTSIDNDADKPTVGYITANGLTDDKDEATDFRGMRGLQGDKGEVGEQGERGFTGANGKSAYQFWLEEGNTGSIQDFIASFGEGITVVPPKYYWGLPITEDRKLDEADIGLSFLVTADAEIEMPDWRTLDRGWFIHLFPSDFGKKTELQIKVTTEGTNTIRGDIGSIQGDVTVIRSPNEGEFLIVGEVKYVTREELQVLYDVVVAYNWTDYWYPNWFPAVQSALASAKVTLDDPNSSNKVIAEKYDVLSSVAHNLGLRITFPCPYTFENGDELGAKNFDSITEVTEGLAFSHHANQPYGVAHAEQPAAAMVTINQVLGNPAMQPISFKDGTDVFSKFNEVRRVGYEKVGFEFTVPNPNNFNTSITFKGTVYDNADGVSELTATIGTRKVGSTVNIVTRLSAERFVGGVSQGVDFVERLKPTTTASHTLGFWYDMTTGKVNFLSSLITLDEIDDFTTNSVSTGKFSTAFPKIDSFGLHEIVSTRVGSVSQSQTVILKGSLVYWTLDFPDGVSDTCQNTLKRATWEEASAPFTSITPTVTESFKQVTTVNIVTPPDWEDSSAPFASITPTVNESLKLITPINLLPEVEWTESSNEFTSITPMVTPTLKLVTSSQ